MRFVAGGLTAFADNFSLVVLSKVVASFAEMNGEGLATACAKKQHDGETRRCAGRVFWREEPSKVFLTHVRECDHCKGIRVELEPAVGSKLRAFARKAAWLVLQRNHLQ